MSERSRARVVARRLAWLFVAGAVVLFLYLIIAPIREIGGVTTPDPQAPTLIRLNQSWDDKVSLRFHHTSQGTRILPLSWFMSLEQPVLTPFQVGKLASRDYLSRFGFIYETAQPSPRSQMTKPSDPPTGNGDPRAANAYEQIEADRDRFDLAVGFAIEPDFRAPYADPAVPQAIPVVGLTCAGCHTSRIEVKLDDGSTRAVLIDGGSAMINIANFQQAVARALFYTQLFGERFRRFARGVLGRDLSASDPALQQLKHDLRRFIELGLVADTYAREHKLNVVDGGYSRTDALGLIGNRVFGVLDQENQIVTNAPVNYPVLWDTAWFDWVQYNASIRTPMARNIGEALGVGALVNLNNPKYPPYDSTVNVKGLAWMEDVLGGTELFQGLKPPSWKDMVLKVFGKPAPANSPYVINEELAREGKTLYDQHCTRCHVPPRDELAREVQNNDFRHFTEPDPGSGKRFVQLKLVELNVIGTDPNEALNFYRRLALTPEPPVAYPNDKPSAINSEPGVKAASPKTPYQSDASSWQSYAYWSRPVKEGYPGEGLFATISAEDGLFRVTSMIRRKNYEDASLQLLLPKGVTFTPSRFPDEAARTKERMASDRWRFMPPPLDTGDTTAIITGEGKDWVIKANLGYRARPHDGVWATGPFLHNGSVPSLYEMLVPKDRRSKKFYLGSTRFEPKNVGYETRKFWGGFEMDTSIAGNSNAGHEFRNLTLEEFEALQNRPLDIIATREQRWVPVLGDGMTLERLATMKAEERWELTRKATESALSHEPIRPITRVLGPEFTEKERWQLVEYLKTL